METSCKFDKAYDGDSSARPKRAVSQCNSVISLGGAHHVRSHHPTRQAIVPHCRHSSTISVAHAPTLPLKIRPERSPCLPDAVHCLRLALKASPRSTPGFASEFMHRNDCVINEVRYSRRLARIWRHVRDRSCSVVRSTYFAT